MRANRTRLPFRNIVIGPTIEPSHGYELLKQHFPSNFVRVSEEDLNWPVGISTNDVHLAEYLKALEPEPLICDLYVHWLGKWKPPPEGDIWHLLIGLDRPIESLPSTWSEFLFDDSDSPVRQVAKVALCAKSNSGDRMLRSTCEDLATRIEIQDYWDQEIAVPVSDKRTLVFDNHGSSFTFSYKLERTGVYHDSSRFYQKLDGAHSYSLTHRLLDPPNNFLGFNFFLLQLIEACIVRAAVFDERLIACIVESDKGQNRISPTKLASFQKSGIFPFFTLRNREHDEVSGSFSNKHLDLAHLEFGSNANKEGLSIQSTGLELFTAIPTSTDSYEIETLLQSRDTAIDVLLLHEGAVDIVTKLFGVEWDIDLGRTLGRSVLS